MASIEIGSYEPPSDTNLARSVAQSYYESRERLGFPMAPREWVVDMQKKAA